MFSSKKSSQFDSDSSLSQLGTVSDRKKVKKEKKKLLSLSSPSMELDESCEDGRELRKKKKKKKKKSLETIIDTEDTSPKKKKKSKKSHVEPSKDSDDLDSDDEKVFPNNHMPKSPKSSKRSLDGMELAASAMSQKRRLMKDGYDDDDNEGSVLEKTPRKKKKGQLDTVQSPLLSSSKKEKTKSRLSLGKKTPIKKLLVNGNGDHANEMKTWSVEEEVLLLDKLIQLNSNSKVTYKKGIEKIKWDEVNLDGHSAKEAEAVLQRLISRVVKVKSLSTVLEEAKEMALDGKDRLKKIQTGKLRFINGYYQKHKHEGQPFDTMRAAAKAAWEQMDPKEKRKYEDEYKNEVAKIKASMDLPPDEPSLPFNLYYEEQLEKGGSKCLQFKNECRKKYKEMSMKQLRKYFVKHCNEWAIYIEAYQKYKDTHPDWNVDIKFPYGREFKEYLDYTGMPKYYASGFSLFVSEMKAKGNLDNISSKNILLTIQKMFRDLSEKEKQWYKDRMLSLKKSFQTRYQEWLESLDKDVALVVTTFCKNPAPVSKAIKPSGRSMAFSNIEEVSIPMPKFPNEPSIPPISALKIFEMKFAKRRRDKYATIKDLRKECKMAWKNLSEEARSKYEQRHAENMNLYTESMVDFVKNLGYMGKVYLGFKRAELVNKLGKDIFEAKFPNKDYPVFVLKKKQVGTLKAVVGIPNEQKSGNVEDGSDEEELESSSEEEEEKPSIKSDEESDSEEGLAAWQTPKKETMKSEAMQEEEEEEEEDDDEEEEEEEEEDSDNY